MPDKEFNEIFNPDDYDPQTLMQYIENNVPEKVCKAHPYLMIFIQGMNKKIDTLNSDLKPVIEYFNQKKTTDEYVDKWKERCYGSLFSLAVIVIGAIILYYLGLR